MKINDVVRIRPEVTEDDCGIMINLDKEKKRLFKVKSVGNYYVMLFGTDYVFDEDWLEVVSTEQKPLMLKTKATVVAVLKRSKSAAFVGIKPGHVLEFSCPIKSVGCSNRGSYAVDIKVENKNTGKVSYLTFNQIGKALDSVELIEET